MVFYQDELREFWAARNKWSAKTFGSKANRGPHGPLAHLKKELKEVRKALIIGYKPQLREEIVDCFFLLGDVAFRSGISHDQFLRDCWAKLEKNKARTWGKPDKDGVVEHVR